MFFIVLIEVLFLVIVAAFCSGLNIAIMSLDISDLKRKANDNDKSAKRVLPFRLNSHLTLASILLTNVAAVSANSILLNHYIVGWIAGIISTLLIVIFGEIFPQALFIKNPLWWSSALTPLMYSIIYLTYPLSKPLQLMLDKLFPKSHSKLQTRHELSLLMIEHLYNSDSELDEDEIEIMRGALQLSEKRVKDIMTNINDVYWLKINTQLTVALVNEIKQRGFSRIPIINDSKTECYGLLRMKQLINIDFDDNALFVSDLSLYPVKNIGSMTALDTLFRKFITAGTHLIPVEKDDIIIGIVTIEDLLEEIINHEIEDESDRSRKLHKSNIINTTD